MRRTLTVTIVCDEIKLYFISLIYLLPTCLMKTPFMPVDGRKQWIIAVVVIFLACWCSDLLLPLTVWQKVVDYLNSEMDQIGKNLDCKSRKEHGRRECCSLATLNGCHEQFFFLCTDSNQPCTMKLNHYQRRTIIVKTRNYIRNRMMLCIKSMAWHTWFIVTNHVETVQFVCNRNLMRCRPKKKNNQLTWIT